MITNCDDDLFAQSERRLGVSFDYVITAQQAGSYKPDHANFLLAFERIDEPRASASCTSRRASSTITSRPRRSA